MIHFAGHRSFCPCLLCTKCRSSRWGELLLSQLTHPFPLCPVGLSLTYDVLVKIGIYGLWAKRNNSSDDRSLEVCGIVKHVCFKMTIMKIQKLCQAFLGSHLLYVKMWCLHHDLSTSVLHACLYLCFLCIDINLINLMSGYDWFKCKPTLCLFAPQSSVSGPATLHHQRSLVNLLNSGQETKRRDFRGLFTLILKSSWKGLLSQVTESWILQDDLAESSPESTKEFLQ